MANTAKVIQVIAQQFDKLIGSLPSGGAEGGIPADSTGSVYYADSVNGASSDTGLRTDNALLTLAQAYAVAVAKDTIIPLELHAETLTVQLALAKAGMRLTGQGTGARRPSLTGNVADDTIDVTAASVIIENILFNEATLVTGGAINVGAVDCIIRNCQFDLGANDSEAITIEAAADNLIIENCLFVVTANGPSAAIEIEEAGVDGLIIRNCTFICSDGTNAFDAAAINSVVANTNMQIYGNKFLGAGIASTAIIATSAIDKNVYDNTYGSGAINADNATRGITPIIAGTNPFGNTWYVVASGGGGGFGHAPGPTSGNAYATIALAIAAASAGDTIILGPGDHSVDVSTAALIPKADMHFIGAVPSYGGMPSTIISVDADDGNDMITIDVDGVVFENIMFQHFLNAGTAIRLINVAQTNPVQGLAFINCWFDMNSADVAGGTALNVDDASNVTEGLVLKNCRFTGGDATSNADNQYIDIGVRGLTAGLIEGCTFGCEGTDDDYVAIRFADPSTTGRGYALVINECFFIGPVDGAVTMTFIVLTGGSSGQFPFIITNCRSSYSTALWVTQDLLDQALVQNYTGDLTAGGTLLIPGT